MTIYKIESNLIGIRKELGEKGYVLDEYSNSRDLERDGLRITKQSRLSTQPGMLESKWLCGIIRYDRKKREELGDLTLRIVDTPFNKELFKIMRVYFEP